MGDLHWWKGTNVETGFPVDMPCRCDNPQAHADLIKHQWWCGGKEPCACTEAWKWLFGPEGAGARAEMQREINRLESERLERLNDGWTHPPAPPCSVCRYLSASPKAVHGVRCTLGERGDQCGDFSCFRSILPAQRVADLQRELHRLCRLADELM